MSLYSKLNSLLTELFGKQLTWIILLCALLVPFFVLALFNHPCGDDFCYAHSVRVNSFWEMQSYWYNNANGRYSATFFITLNPLMVGSVLGYKMVMLCLLIVYVFVTVFVVKFMLGKKNIDLSVLAITFFILFVYILKMPSVVEGFYWLAAVMTYQLATVSVMLLLLVLSRMKKETHNMLLIAVAMVLCLIISGSNEPVMLMLLYLLIVLSSFTWITSRKIPAYYYVLIVVTVIGILSVVLAPGNSVRSSFFEGNKQLVHSLIMASVVSIQHLVLWLPDVLLMTLLFIPFMKECVAPGFTEKKVPIWLLLLYPFFMIGILFIGFFPAQWGMNGLPPPRSLDEIYFLFLLAYLYYVMLLMTYVKQEASLPVIPLYVKCIVAFVLFTHVSMKNNIRTAYMDILSGRVVSYERQMNRRYEQIGQSKNGDVSVSPIVLPPSSVFLDDIETSTDDWKNVCTSDYFQVKSLKISQPIHE
ncbi:MAG: hypothetical protein JWO58_1652 [Chitinophagaceae bacterium]|nr:hypothetical protein [Chitinophagaceae bacterium]